MSNHKVTLVPLATGYFQSPDLFVRGQVADTGLFAESLIYYESVYVHVDNPEQFAGFISLLVQQGCTYERLIELVEEGTLRFYNSVMIMPFMGFGRNDMVSSLWAIQESAMDEPRYFLKRYLEFEGLKNSFTTLGNFERKYFERFCEAAEKSAITFNNNDISEGIVDNAYQDFLSPKRNELIVKNLVKETFKANQLGKPPKVNVKIREVDGNYDVVARNTGSYVIGRNLDNDEYKIYEVDYNRDFRLSLKKLNNTKTPVLNALGTLPLSAAGQTNLIIRSANKLNCDLYLANPISKIVGDKLYEITATKKHKNESGVAAIIDKLEAKVEFPDLRRFVNEGKVDFEKVLEIRSKSRRFREWLQCETERDRDAIIAYHNEIAKQTGFEMVGKTTLNVFGVLASVAASIGVEAFFRDSDTVAKETAKQIGSKIVDSAKDRISTKLLNEWKPVCFGDWYKKEIAEVVEE